MKEKTKLKLYFLVVYNEYFLPSPINTKFSSINHQKSLTYMNYAKKFMPLLYECTEIMENLYHFYFSLNLPKHVKLCAGMNNNLILKIHTGTPMQSENYKRDI